MWVWCLQVVKINGLFITAKTKRELWSVTRERLYGSNWSRLASPWIMQMMERVFLHARGMGPTAVRKSTQNTTFWLQNTGLLFLTKRLHAMEKRPLPTTSIQHIIVLSVSEFDNNGVDANHFSRDTLSHSKRAYLYILYSQEDIVHILR